MHAHSTIGGAFTCICLRLVRSGISSAVFKPCRLHKNRSRLCSHRCHIPVLVSVSQRFSPTCLACSFSLLMRHWQVRPPTKVQSSTDSLCLPARPYCGPLHIFSVRVCPQRMFANSRFTTCTPHADPSGLARLLSQVSSQGPGHMASNV